MSFLLDDYDYVLPPERIAQYPVEPRDSSRLLVIDRKHGSWQHRSFRELPELLDGLDCLVANNTEVLRARLLGHRCGGRVARRRGRDDRGGRRARLGDRRAFHQGQEVLTLNGLLLQQDLHQIVHLGPVLGQHLAGTLVAAVNDRADLLVGLPGARSRPV